ncbi:MAG TPA: hypothetical protein PLA27_13735 [Anaerolineales bacterium]|jgi:hypothetical protein|nr:hypothetical protein [Anaerolineales bacterium]
MKIGFIVSLICFFLIGCVAQPATKQVSVNFPENTETLIVPTEEPTRLMSTVIPTANAEFPRLSKGLPNEIKVSRQELPIRFETPLSNIPNGNYIVYSKSDQPINADLKQPTLEFWAISIDTYEKYLLFMCESCSHILNQYVAYREGQIYLGSMSSECGGAMIDLRNRTSVSIKVDLSLTPPESQFHFCTISPNFHRDIFQYHPISPDGKWQVFGTASALATFPNVPALARTLLLYSMETDEWLTLETDTGITGVLWTPNGDLLVEVAKNECEGKIGAYLVSLEQFTIYDLKQFLCNLERPSPRILGWLPDERDIAIAWDIYNSSQILSTIDIDQFSICPAESVYSLDTSQCQKIKDNITSDLPYSSPLWIDEQGLFIGKSAPEGSLNVSIVNMQGSIDDHGVISGGYVSDVSLELGKIILITGKERNILTYADLKDVSRLVDFKMLIENIGTAFWLIIP